MLKRYAIWDKKTPIITPIYEVFTSEQWIERYPAFGIDSVIPVCGVGETNGSFASTLGQMVQIYTAQGADFSGCTTNEEKLEVIEAFEDAMSSVSDEPTTDERIAAALEAQVMLSMPDTDVTDTTTNTTTTTTEG